MLTTDDTVRFVMNRDGYYVGQPLRGDGTFGNWSLARVMVQDRTFMAIEFERALTEHEVQSILNQPIMYWFTQATPLIKPAGNTWALMVCRYSPHAQTNRTIVTTPKHTNDPIRKIGV